MSFASDTRQELCRELPEEDCCRTAKLAALVRFAATLRLSSRGLGIRFDVESAALARHLFVLIKQQTGEKPLLVAVADPRLGRSRRYQVSLEGEAAKQVLLKSDMLDEHGALHLSSQLPLGLLRRRCCKRAFIQGAFLAVGTLSHPQRAYHAEFQMKDFELAGALCDLLQKLDLHARVHARRDHFVIYIKQAEDVSSLLAQLGANQALIEYENIRISKQVMGNTNRFVNCDTANTNKTLAAAQRQVAHIKLLMQNGGMDRLPPPLRDMAAIRLEQPDASLDELAAALGISKSGVNHRLRKLESLAQALRTEGSV